MWGERIWARLLEPPFDRHGDRILAVLLGVATAVGGAVITATHLDEVMAAGQAAPVGLCAGALFGGMLVLAALALTAGAAHLLGPARGRLVGGVITALAATVLVVGYVRPLLRADPRLYSGTPDAKYERTYYVAGRITRTETVSGVQLSTESWVRNASGALVAAGSLGLLAPLQFAVAWIVARGNRAETAPARAAGPPRYLRWLLGSCPGCGRVVIERWRRCPSCRGLLPFSYQRRPDADATLTLLAWLGVVVAAFGGLAALVMHLEGSPAAAAVLLAFSAAFLAIHAALKWWAWAFNPMRVIWFALAVFAVGALWRTPVVALLAAALPVAVCIELLVLGHGLRDYVRGIPGRTDGASASTDEFDGFQCRVCSAAAARIVAPVWCVSFIFLSERRLGRPKLVCERHARLRALPAAAVSMVAGWWGIPWGIVWTPAALWQDLSRGGVQVDRNSALESVVGEGPLAIDRRHVLLFMLSVVALAALLIFDRVTTPSL